ncbi:hypothetical protein [Flavobacterium sp. J27]|uniref:hypothetical protein n=1 Tax=Flavobacterium sp. J27 TaxID=2060419 RepID=UPI001030A0AF|nr:hypothetical protein [Flavobacterium sp. J27]
MKTSILNLAGVRTLSKMEQKKVNGGTCENMYFIHNTTQYQCENEEFGVWLGGSTNTCRVGSC